MRLKTAIVDDELLARRHLEVLLAEDPDILIAGSFARGSEALTWIREHAPDLVFLDIQMPGMSGLELLRELLTDPPEPLAHIVFVTAFDQFALQAFELHALDYLLKPFAEARFREALRHAKERVRQRRDAHGLYALSGSDYPAKLTFRDQGGLHVLRVNDLVWVESADHYLVLHSRCEQLVWRYALRDLQARLDPARFARIHRTALINLSFLTSLTRDREGVYWASLSTGPRLRVSRRRYRALAEQLAMGLP